MSVSSDNNDNQNDFTSTQLEPHSISSSGQKSNDSGDKPSMITGIQQINGTEQIIQKKKSLLSQD